jgi:hypothetical protein
MSVGSELTTDELIQLAQLRPPMPVLSLYLRTDPRDPSNRTDPPAWRIAARNGLRDAAARIDEHPDRDVRLAFRGARESIERELDRQVRAVSGRAVAWFVSLDGSLERRVVLQLPVRAPLVRLDRQPVISPLVDSIEHGRRTGVVLVSADRVRSLEWADGRVDEADDEEFTATTEHWRAFAGPGAPSSGRQSATHVEHFAARVEEHRERFLAAAARATVERCDERGWERLAIAGEGPAAVRFHARLPDSVAGRVVADLDLNIVNAPALEIAERLEPHLDAAWRGAAIALAESLPGQAAAGAPVAIGPGAVLVALAERRVEHLVLDPYHEPTLTALAPSAQEVVGDAPSDLIGERAVEAAIAARTAITPLELGASRALTEADGMLARLRW